MKLRRAFDLFLVVVGIVILIFEAAPSSLSSVSPQPYYYTCTVNSETNIGVSNCFMVLVGPEPDGSFYAGAGLSFFSLTCATASSTWNPSITWQFSPGNTSVGIGPSPQHYSSLPAQIALTWTITVPGYSGTAQGTGTLYPAAGTNSFVNKYNPQSPSCAATSTTSTTVTSSTSTTGTTTSTASTVSSSISATSTASNSPTGTSGGTTPAPRPQLDPVGIGIAGALIVAGGADSFLGSRRRR